MFDKYEREITKALLSILEEDLNEKEMLVKGKAYSISVNADGSLISISWDNGFMQISEWKKNWAKTVELFAAILRTR